MENTQHYKDKAQCPRNCVLNRTVMSVREQKTMYSAVLSAGRLTSKTEDNLTAAHYIALSFRPM